MPGQRMLHPEQSMSRKVTALSDFEYRVFEQTKLSSDDFGVMPYTAAVLRADNLRLLKATEQVVFKALQQLVTLGLLLVFDHQSVPYVCAPQWQKWQQVRFPRKTTHPKPDDAILAQCHDETRELFTKYPGGKRDGRSTDKRPSHDGQKTDKSPAEDRHKSGHLDAQVHADADANANAHANASGRGAGETAAGPRRHDRQHADHIDGFCAFKCLSDAKVWEFAKDLPGAQADPKNFDRALEWAEHVRDTWGDQPKLEFEWFKFWEARWKERAGVPSASQVALQRLVARVQARVQERLS